MRRAVLFVIGVLLLPLAAGAQRPEKIARVGLLSPFSASATALWHEAFRQGLRDLGWVEGKNITIEYRYAEGRDDRLASLAADLVRLNVDAIVTTVTSDALAAKKATTTIPIVMASAGDPVGSGLVETLARPGGNVTGLSQIAPELAGKRLALLKEIAPGLSHVAAMWNPKDRSSALSWTEIQQPARELGVQLQSLGCRARLISTGHSRPRRRRALARSSSCRIR